MNTFLSLPLYTPASLAAPCYPTILLLFTANMHILASLSFLLHIAAVSSSQSDTDVIASLPKLQYKRWLPEPLQSGPVRKAPQEIDLRTHNGRLRRRSSKPEPSKAALLMRRPRTAALARRQLDVVRAAEVERHSPQMENIQHVGEQRQREHEIQELKRRELDAVQRKLEAYNHIKHCNPTVAFWTCLVGSALKKMERHETTWHQVQRHPR